MHEIFRTSKINKQLETVKDITDAMGSWKAFDTNFRVFVAQELIAWSDVNMGFYVNARLTTNTNLPTKPNKIHKNMQYSFMSRGSVSNSTQINLVQQVCLVASNKHVDVLTVSDHTYSFNVQSHSISHFVSSKSIKTKQEVQIQNQRLSIKNTIIVFGW